MVTEAIRFRPRYHRWHVDPGIDWVESNTAYAHLDWTIHAAGVPWCCSTCGTSTT